MVADRGRRAAQYVRMSTEHQQYSIAYQSATNAAYACAHGLDLVATYTDAGRSGLTMQRRDGLRQLLADAVSDHRKFDVVLVYDVSRWGRFQDPDEAGHYEFLCREAGIRVEYTAEPFQNDGSMTSALMKHIKRAMAAEYVRELSGRVARAQRGLSAQGYWMGGPPGYGFRRQVVDASGRRGPVLDPGQGKASGQRTVLALGPAVEVATVRRIFRLFGQDRLRVGAIAALLNAEGVTRDGGKEWTSDAVRRVLKDERYAGVLVAGKTSYFLHARQLRSPGDWIRLRGGAPQVVSSETFRLAARRLRRRRPVPDEESLLEELRAVLRRRGALSRNLVEADPQTHSCDVYRRRFGSLTEAFERAGYTPTRQQARAAALARRYRPFEHRVRPEPMSDAALLNALQALLAAKGRLTVGIIDVASDVPPAEVYRRRFGGMRRVYALVGFAPSEFQDQLMDKLPGQTISRADAAALRAAVAVASSGPQQGGREPPEDDGHRDQQDDNEAPS